MVKRNTTKKDIEKRAVKATASFVKGVARYSVSKTCFLFFHEPEKPFDMAYRLKKMKWNVLFQNN